MEITLLSWMLSASPIFIFLFVVLVLKWGGGKAGAFSWLAAVFFAIFFFGAKFDLIAFSYVKAFLLSIDVLLIIWSAMLLFTITEQAGTIKVIGSWLASFTSNRALQGILLGWLFPSFLQGMSGFGVPVAVAAPLLVSTGFNPIQAMVMASIGHAWAVSFGSMASSFQTMLSITNFSYEILAPDLTVLLGIAAIFCGFLVTYIADGFRGVKSTFFLTLSIGIILGVGEYLLATNGMYILAVIIPALIALVLSVLFIATKDSKKPGDCQPSKKVIGALLPYTILVSLTLTTELVKPIQKILAKYTFSFHFPEIATTLGYVTAGGLGRSIKLLNHPGLVILLSCVSTFIIFIKLGYLRWRDYKSIIRLSAKKSINTTITIFTMVGIAVIMSHTGMTDILAEGISRFFNRDFFPFVSPFVGAAGAFITGSNNNSNVLFAALQMRTAQLLGLSSPLILAAQSAGGGIGSIMAPAKVILGSATVGLEGREGDVIGKILLYGLVLLIMVGFLAVVFAKSGIFYGK